MTESLKMMVILTLNGGWVSSPEFITALGTLIMALSAMIATIKQGSKVKEVRDNTQEVKETTQAVKESIGERNGQSITQILHTIKEMNKYNHHRNHEIMNTLTKLSLKMELEPPTFTEPPPLDLGEETP